MEEKPAAPEKDLGGRPPKFNLSMVSLAEQYADGGWVLDVNVAIPTIEELAGLLKVSAKTVYEWLKHDESEPAYEGIERFISAIVSIKNQQAKIVLNGGLLGKYNPVISKLILSTNHGYKEKSDVTTDDQPLPAPSSTLPGAMTEDVKRAVSEAYQEAMRKELTSKPRE